MPTSALVLGGGVAGMSAAHHLIRRGFDVTVVERNPALGGKARSATAGATGLPSEHGFRFFAGFYHHLIETLKEIDYDGQSSVFDRLVAVPELGFARQQQAVVRFHACPPGAAPVQGIGDVVSRLSGALAAPLGVPGSELAVFAGHLWRVMTSCKERREDEFNQISWWDFIEADQHSPGYGVAFGRTIRTLVAADPRRASAKVMGDCALALLLGLTVEDECFDRILDGPTSEAWIEPWHALLLAHGVRVHTETRVAEIECDGTAVTGVRVRDAAEQERVETADYYVAALPVEAMAELLTAPLLAADPGLSQLIPLAEHVAWMSGMQFYLNQRVEIFPGHLLLADSPWSVTAIPQAQFWPRVDFPSLHDGNVAECVSAIVSDFDTPGNGGKEARFSTPTEIRDEVWQQLTDALAGEGVGLRPEMVHHYHQDPAIVLKQNGHPHANLEPLLVNDVGTWSLRPDATTAIPNLLLAADYVRTHTDLATMEAADEAARRAVNAIVPGAPLEVVDVHEHPSLAAVRALDRLCYVQGVPWCVSPLSSLTNP